MCFKRFLNRKNVKILMKKVFYEFVEIYKSQQCVKKFN
jgi:hypothetical protein